MSLFFQPFGVPVQSATNTHSLGVGADRSETELALFWPKGASMSNGQDMSARKEAQFHP